MSETTSKDSAVKVVETVRKGYRSGRTHGLTWRYGQLENLKRMLVEREQEFVVALEADLGKSAFESWLGELNIVKSEIDHTLGHLGSWVSAERVSIPLAMLPGKGRIYREPLGVVLIIGPWNYPVNLILAPLIGAIAAGNAAVLKPSEIASATSTLLAKLVPEYLDKDCIAVVEGGIPETTELLQQQFDHVFYTGNGTVGRIVMRAAAEHLTPVTLELGGKSPCIVDKNANLEVAAKRIVWGKFFNAGQTCVAPDYLLVDKEIADEFCKKLVKTIKSFYGPDPKESQDFARIINAKHFDRLVKALGDTDVLCGGENDRDNKYLAPTLVRGISEDHALMQEEIFGPILPILEVANLEEAIAFVGKRDKPLALYVFTEDKKVAQAVLSRTTSGGACVNEVIAHLSVPDLPFGGVGPSGMGAYHGKAGFEVFSHKKSVLHKSSRLDVPVRYPPYDEKKINWAKRLI